MTGSQSPSFQVVPPAEMGDLTHGFCPMPVNPVGQRLEMRDDRVVRCVDLTKHGWGVGGR